MSTNRECQVLAGRHAQRQGTVASGVGLKSSATWRVVQEKPPRHNVRTYFQSLLCRHFGKDNSVPFALFLHFFEC